MMTLSRHAEAKAMLSWFQDRDLVAARSWFHVSASLDQRLFREEPDTAEPGAKFFQLLKPLVSNDDALVRWFATFEVTYDPVRVENRRLQDFWAYQGVLCIRGEWDRVIRRSQEAIQAQDIFAKAYLPDFNFALALATGNVDGMENALREMTGPGSLKARQKDDSGYATGLISTASVIYAKIAWRHGHKVSIDSPYIPLAWLECQPLATYADPYNLS